MRFGWALYRTLTAVAVDSAKNRQKCSETPGANPRRFARDGAIYRDFVISLMTLNPTA
jgi:hypothetical protein